MDYQKRLKKVQNKLKQKQIDALLVSNYYNLFYLSGFSGLSKEEREAWIFISQDEGYFFTDGRYRLSISENLPFEVKTINSAREVFAFIGAHFQKYRLKTLAIEADDLKLNEYFFIKDIFKEIELVPMMGFISEERMVKDNDEIEMIKKACLVADDCLFFLEKTIKKGQKEKEIVLMIERWVGEKGYQLAFPPIVAIDQNSSIPHYNSQKNGQEKIKDNSLILVDMGVAVGGYCSDITRIFFFGHPNQRQIIVYQNLLKAQQKTISFIKNGQPLKVIDRFCRENLKNYPFYSHSTGHGVGLEVHEFPKIASGSSDFVLEGMVFTIEPGIYLPDEWGIRIEDLVFINEKGKIEILTHFPREIRVIE